MEFPDGPAVVRFCSDITARKQVEKKLQETNEKLATWVNELEERNREMAQLSEMGELLQSCQILEEVYSVSAKFVQRLFSGVQGSLYLINNSREMVEEVARWGESQSSERLFLPGDCWALRRGRLHLVSAPNFGLLCQHITNPQEANYLCVPLLAHGEALGVLYLQYGLNEPEAEKYFDEHRQHLAAAVADHVALALANLKLREALRQQAIRDLLTGLFNRRYMEESLERELRRAERGGTSVGVIMSDIDKFKEFNDLFGHDGGDTLLRDLGVFLKKRMRGEDIVCRYGGEEFVFVLPDATLESTRQWAEELRRAVKELRVYHLGKPLGPIAMSFGVAVFPEHGSTVEKILNRADIALYRAKNEGRDRVIIASQEE
jgi:diguanylate cyclase (GGDEF)-like protein